MGDKKLFPALEAAIAEPGWSTAMLFAALLTKEGRGLQYLQSAIFHRSKQNKPGLKDGAQWREFVV